MRFDSIPGVTGRDIGQQGRSTTASGPDRERCDPLACATGLSAVISDNRLPRAILRGLREAFCIVDHPAPTVTRSENPAKAGLAPRVNLVTLLSVSRA